MSASLVRHVTIAGHFAPEAAGADGQIVRSRAVRDELLRELGVRAVRQVDTSARDVFRLVGMHAALWRALMASDVLVALPGARAVRYLLPQYIAWHRLTGRPVHLIAVGGWLPSLAAMQSSVRHHLASCECVYVQTQRMLAELSSCGLNNGVLFPNFRRFPSSQPPQNRARQPIRAVFCGRVTSLKGVETAVSAVQLANVRRARTCTLDIYGPVKAEDREWYQSVESRFTDETRYLGTLAPAKVTEALRQYDLLLLPTTYPGEGFPGVLLEAMISGLAILASDWMANSEFVRDGVNGFVLPPTDVSAYADSLMELADNRELLLELRQGSTREAIRYHPDAVMPKLLRGLGRLDPSEQ